MDDIMISRYKSSNTGYLGWVEPADKSWILFIRDDGIPQFYGRRNQGTGAVLG